MTNEDRNTRTLIVSFVIAIMALVPLRIFESRNAVMNEVKVLGDQEEVLLEEEYLPEDYEGESEYLEEDVELPNAEFEE